jgi:hypothetical protein
VIRQLLFGCPVCRQRTRHLVFCRYRPAGLDVPPIMWPVAATVLFWGLVGYSITGWVGVGAAVMAVALALLLCAACADVARNQARSPTGTPREEVVGALYPREMRHIHREKGVCTARCQPKTREAA